MSVEIRQFIADYPESVGALSDSLRTFVKEAAPDCSETLHVGWKVISYGHTRKFCAIAPHSGWVNLQFHSGTELRDPSSLLQGTGKSMRHVKIAGAEDFGPGLRQLVEQAAELAK